MPFFRNPKVFGVEELKDLQLLFFVLTLDLRGQERAALDRDSFKRDLQMGRLRYDKVQFLKADDLTCLILH